MVLPCGHLYNTESKCLNHRRHVVSNLPNNNANEGLKGRRDDILLEASLHRQLLSFVRVEAKFGRAKLNRKIPTVPSKL